MNKLAAAVKAGIISHTQKAAIEALSDDPVGFRLSLVHVLWVGGIALIVFALCLLAIELSRGDAAKLVLICLFYAVILLVLDMVVHVRTSLRLLSAVILFGVGLCLLVAVISFQDVLGQPTYFQDWRDVPRWSGPIANPPPRLPYHPLIHGVYFPVLVLGGVAGYLLVRRDFLPSWVALSVGFAVAVLDIYIGLGGRAPHWAFLGVTLVLLGAGWYADVTKTKNHGFWLNKMGVLAFSFYAVFDALDGGYGRDLPTTVLLVSLGLIAFSVFIRRPGGVWGGAMGVAFYLLEWFDEWDNYVLAAAVLAVLGLAVIFVGVRAHLVEDQLDELLPKGLRAVRPPLRTDPVTFGF